MNSERDVSLALARRWLPDARRDEGLPGRPGYWRLRDLADMRLSLEVFAGACARDWRRVGARP